MKCDDFLLYASLYLDNDLDEATRIEFEKHMNMCKACKNEFEQLQIAFNDIKEFSYIDPLDEASLPTDLHVDIMKSIENLNKPNNVIPLFWKNSKTYIAAAVIFICVFSLNDILKSKNTLTETSDGQLATISVAPLENDLGGINDTIVMQNDSASTSQEIISGNLKESWDYDISNEANLDSENSETYAGANLQSSESQPQRKAIIEEETTVFTEVSEEFTASIMRNTINASDDQNMETEADRETPLQNADILKSQKMHEMALSEEGSAPLLSTGFSMMLDEANVITISLTEQSLGKILDIFNEYSLTAVYYDGETRIFPEEVLQYDAVNIVVTTKDSSYDELLLKLNEIKNEFSTNNKVITITINKAE